MPAATSTPTPISSGGFTGYYQVTVSRIGSDAYRDQIGGSFLVTSGCFEFVFYDSARAYWVNGAPYRLVFSSGQVCSLVVHSNPNATLTRISSNAYRDDMNGGFVLYTRLCLELALADGALVTDRPNWRILFRSAVCDLDI